MLKIVGISGSLRADSQNRKIIDLADRLAGDEASITIFDLNPIPMYNPDDETTSTPESVVDLRERVVADDGVLIACPTYYLGMTGAMKNAMDWLCRNLKPTSHSSALFGKPAAVLGGGGGMGSKPAQDQIKEIMTAVGATVMEKPDVDFADLPERSDNDGYLKSRSDIAQVEEFVQAFLNHVEIGSSAN